MTKLWERITSSTFVRAAAVRCVKTMAQTAGGIVSASVLLTDVDWAFVGSGTALAGLLSLLTSVAGLPEVKE